MGTFKALVGHFSQENFNFNFQCNLWHRYGVARLISVSHMYACIFILWPMFLPAVTVCISKWDSLERSSQCCIYTSRCCNHTCTSVSITWFTFYHSPESPVADPGFPVGGGRGPRRGGRGLPRRLRFKNFACQNERIWTRRGGRAPGAPLDPPMITMPKWTHIKVKIHIGRVFLCVQMGTYLNFLQLLLCCSEISLASIQYGNWLCCLIQWLNKIFQTPM